MSVKAIHINWTKPFFEKDRLRGHGFKVFKNNKSKEYSLPTYQILVTKLSILNWKKWNGPIKLYTDSIGKAYYDAIGLLELYDEVDTDILDNYNDVDAAYFWTSGKINCLQYETEPFVFIDNDFIVREKINEYRLKQFDLIIGYWEIPRGYYYFTKYQFQKEIKHCRFPENYNCNSLTPNTSFMYFNNLNLVKEYVNAHSKLVDNKGVEVPEWFWLMTDQGILGHCIREGNYNVGTITNRVFLSDSDHTDSTQRYKGMSEPWFQFIDTDNVDKFSWEHLWYLKAHFNDDKEMMLEYCNRYNKEIKMLCSL